MRKRTLGVVLLAGLAMSGAGAFTTSNDVAAVDGTEGNLAGFGNADVTGAVVEAINYTHDETSSTITQVVFYATGTMLDADGSVIMYDSTSASLGEYTCVAASGPGAVSVGGITLGATTTKFTCDLTSGPVSVEDFESIGITVTR